VKTAEEMVDEIFSDGPDGRKTAATSLRRLRGGIEAQLKSANFYGLTEKDVKTLRDSVELLSRMSDLRMKAGRLKVKKQAATVEREIAVKAAMARTFGQVSSIEDKVSFVASVSPSFFKDWEDPTEKQVKALDTTFHEAMDTLVYRFARRDGLVETIVTENWNLFLQHKEEYAKRYAGIIYTLRKMADATLQP
jgi:hypothetical protein